MFTSRRDAATPIHYVLLTPSILGRLEEVRAFRDTQPARIVLFSPDSATLVCSTLDSVSLWDVERGQKKAQLQTAALHVTYSPDGATLVITGRDLTFFDTRTGKKTQTLKGHTDGTTGVAFSPDGVRLATGGMDGVVRVGNLKTQRLIRTFEHPAPVRGLAFSPDGDTVATVSWGSGDTPRSITLWSVQSGAKLQSMKCQSEKNLVFSPNGRLLAVDGTLYDPATLQVVHDLQDRVIAFSPDSQLVASCRSDYTTIGLWDAVTGQKLLVLKGHSESVWSLAFSPDGKYLASGSGKLAVASIHQDAEEAGDKGIRLWGVPEKDPDPTQPLLPSTKTLRRLSR
ncbi:MAG: WD40 repeat domain-containing protein [Anaerolineae bacterium]|nr:WD40 repeat domain-containing protein [Anaerolineae bacterium]